MVPLGPEPFPAVDASRPIEARRVSQLQGGQHLDRDVLGPALEVT